MNTSLELDTSISSTTNTSYKVIEFSNLKITVQVAEDLCPNTYGYMYLKDKLYTVINSSIHEYLYEFHHSHGYEYY